MTKRIIKRINQKETGAGSDTWNQTGHLPQDRTHGNGRLQLQTNMMIPYKIAWTPRCMERRRTRTGTVPGEKNGLLKTASLPRIFGFRISGRNSRNHTRDGGNTDGQIYDPKSDVWEPWRIETRTRDDGRNMWRKIKRRSSRIDERYLNIGQRLEMPERKRTVTPTMLQTLEKMAHGARSAKSETGVRRPRKRIVLRTCELRGPTSNYGIQKKRGRRGTERKLATSPGDESQTGYGFEKN